MKEKRILALLLMLMLMLSGCAYSDAQKQTETQKELPYEPELPDTIRLDEKSVPVMRVYIVDEDRIEEMDIETYLWGVLAGEMKNDWPLEALKAQAILARTFVVKFLSEKQSKYQNVDISTDIEEAQAYDAAGINDRIKKAVRDTRGIILTYEGEPIYAWFHAHAGGRTVNAAEGLSYRDAAPYTQSVKSTENESAAPDAANWSARFTEDEVIKAAKSAGVNVGESIESVAAGEKGASGRVRNLRINGLEVPANELRIALGSSRMRSTLLTSVSWKNGELSMSGKGYGHGVGMSQWGAYAMAENGEKAENIIRYYFNSVDIVQKWK